MRPELIFVRCGQCGHTVTLIFGIGGYFGICHVCWRRRLPFRFTLP